MYEQVEKSKENTASADWRKSRSVANSVAQKKSNIKQGFGFVDNRPKTIVQRKLQEMATDYSERNFQIEGKNINTVNMSNVKSDLGIVQGKFVDLEGMKLDKAVPELIKAGGTQYEALWYPLKGSTKSVHIAPTDGMSSYDPSTNTLYFKPEIVNSLLDADLDPAVRVSHIAAITHEMQHAYDHMVAEMEVDGGLPDEATKKILTTELRAWASEAVSAIQMGQKMEAMDEEKGKLIESWLSYESTMLENLGEHKQNEIIKRLYNYIRRGVSPSDTSEIPQWAKANATFINDLASPLKNWVESFMKKN